MKTSAAVAASTFLGIGAACAADLPYTKARPMAAPVATYDWSGIYVGGHIGYQWSRFDDSFVASTIPVPRTNSDFGVGGGQIGIQKQWGQFVLGVEAGATALFSTPKPQVAFPTIAFTHGTSFTNDPIFYVGGRAGYAVNNWLPYVTGGYASAKFAWTDFNTAGVNDENGTTARADGYYIGGGIEYAVASNWILGVEYRHYQFDRKLAPAITPAGVAIVADDKIVDPKADTVLFRASYKFNWAAPAPVVAKY